MCTFFGVSRSGYYDFVNRMDKADRDEPLRKEIAECHQLCRKTYGYRRVHIWLEKVKGIQLNPKTVLRIMNKYGLLSEIRRRRKYKQMGQQLHKYANLLNRDFHADKPNQSGSQIFHTSILGKAFCIFRSFVICTITVLLSTKRAMSKLSIWCWTPSKQPRKKKRSLPSCSSTATKGFNGYFNLTKEYGITPSMSRRGNCYDNAMAENFFSILKSECINRQKIENFCHGKIPDWWLHLFLQPWAHST